MIGARVIGARVIRAIELSGKDVWCADKSVRGGKVQLCAVCGLEGASQFVVTMR